MSGQLGTATWLSAAERKPGGRWRRRLWGGVLAAGTIIAIGEALVALQDPAATPSGGASLVIDGDGLVHQIKLFAVSQAQRHDQLLQLLGEGKE